MADEKAEQAALGNLIRQKRQARGLSQELSLIHISVLHRINFHRMGHPFHAIMEAEGGVFV